MTTTQIIRSSSTLTPPLAPMATMASMESACTVGDAGVSESCVVIGVGGSLSVVGIVVADEGSGGVVGAVVLSGPREINAGKV